MHNVADIDLLLNESKTSGVVVKIETARPDGTAFDAIVINSTAALCSIKLIRDFELDGIAVFPKRRIRGVRRGDYERCTDLVVRAATRSPPPPLPAWSSAATLEEVLTGLERDDTWPLIEIVHKKQSIVYIGRIVDVSPDAVTMRSYDAAGRWEGETTLEMDHISRVEIESRYLRHFNQYVRSISTSPA